jgi:hypothetical protein
VAVRPKILKLRLRSTFIPWPLPSKKGWYVEKLTRVRALKAKKAFYSSDTAEA